jgi:hypothetical protein
MDDENMINDTTPEAERVLIEVFRRMSIGDKSRRLDDLYRTGRALHEAGFASAVPMQPLKTLSMTG